MGRTTALQISCAVAAVSALAAYGGTSIAAATAGSPRPGRTAAVKNLITLKDIQFHPGVIHIRRGQSVTWKWEDGDIDTQHNVTSIGSKRFKSSPTKMSGTYTLTFSTSGTYAFECTIHPASMQGKVVVS